MSAAAVQDILERIRQLPAEDRQLLEQRLAELAEAEWRREAEAARSRSRAIGLDQAQIDQAIEGFALSLMKVFFDTCVYAAEALLGAGAEQMLGAIERASCGYSPAPTFWTNWNAC